MNINDPVMPSVLPPSVRTPVQDTHVYIKKKFTLSNVAITYVISVFAASIAEIGKIFNAEKP